MRHPTLHDLRRHAVARSLFAPTSLPKAIERLGFVQADPIRAPARAQDLTLRHRVAGYRAGDLERRYPRLAIEEDCLVNYGFLPRGHLALLHPRTPRRDWDAAQRRRAAQLLDFIRARGPTHPREATAAFDHGRVAGYWGGTLNATTQLLDGLHYRGQLRVARRESGTRVYEAVEPREPERLTPAERASALLELVIAKYAPLPAPSLAYLARLLEYGAPQLRPQIQAALGALKARGPGAVVDGVGWYWPVREQPASQRWRAEPDGEHAVRLLAPFDPIVWDRRRFALLWGWTYKFEAYTPASQRRLGYYALPLLWGDRVIGWANIRVTARGPQAEFGHALGPAPRDPAFRRGLEAELARLRDFLGAPTG